MCSGLPFSMELPAEIPRRWNLSGVQRQNEVGPVAKTSTAASCGEESRLGCDSGISSLLSILAQSRTTTVCSGRSLQSVQTTRVSTHLWSTIPLLFKPPTYHRQGLSPMISAGRYATNLVVWLAA
jgi:hypothetical protein